MTMRAPIVAPRFIPSSSGAPIHRGRSLAQVRMAVSPVTSRPGTAIAVEAMRAIAATATTARTGENRADVGFGSSSIEHRDCPT